MATGFFFFSSPFLWPAAPAPLVIRIWPVTTSLPPPCVWRVCRPPPPSAYHQTDVVRRFFPTESSDAANIAVSRSDYNCDDRRAHSIACAPNKSLYYSRAVPENVRGKKNAKMKKKCKKIPSKDDVTADRMRSAKSARKTNLPTSPPGRPGAKSFEWQLYCLPIIVSSPMRSYMRYTRTTMMVQLRLTFFSPVRQTRSKH